MCRGSLKCPNPRHLKTQTSKTLKRTQTLKTRNPKLQTPPPQKKKKNEVDPSLQAEAVTKSGASSMTAHGRALEGG